MNNCSGILATSGSHARMGPNGRVSWENLIHNEKQKLRAAFLNNLAVAAFVGGIIAPMFDRSGLSTLSVLASIGSGIIVGVIFHSGALWCLSDLKEDCPHA
jgi:hypothetical protein